MRRILILLIAIVGLNTVPAFADKPGWAGEGGKPTDAEIERHKEEMRNKNSDKNSRNEDDWDADQDKDKDKDKDKNKK
jgi:hypothetical protein